LHGVLSRAAGLGVIAVTASLALPATISAMRQYSSDFGDKDPCAEAGVGEGGGTLTRTYRNPSISDKQVSVKLVCSPLLSMKSFQTLLFDDIVRQPGNHPGLISAHEIKSPVLRGNATFLNWLSTTGHPFIHGEIAEALRLQTFQAAPSVANALISGGATLTSQLAVSGIICAVGGLPTLGIACAAASAALGGAAVGALVAALASVTKDMITTQVNRIKAMGNADWFVWSNSLVTWNSFGDITDTSINPSLTYGNPNPFHNGRIRVGVQFNDAAAGGAPDFFSLPASRSRRAHLIAPDTRAPMKGLGGLGEQIGSLNFNANAFGFAPNGRERIRTGGRGANDLHGGPGNDSVQALGGPDEINGRGGDDTILGGAGSDAISGGPGRDVLLARDGDDQLSGGSGHDVLIGHAGADELRGGGGSDWLLDSLGPTTVHTGARPPQGTDKVNVRDGAGDDTVICDSSQTRVSVDDGDRVRGRCGMVWRRGPVLQLPH
jgi:hypothetical protein